MKKKLLLFSILLGSIFYVNAQEGGGGDGTPKITATFEIDAADLTPDGYVVVDAKTTHTVSSTLHLTKPSTDALSATISFYIGIKNLDSLHLYISKVNIPSSEVTWTNDSNNPGSDISTVPLTMTIDKNYYTTLPYDYFVYATINQLDSAKHDVEEIIEDTSYPVTFVGIPPATITGPPTVTTPGTNVVAAYCNDKTLNSSNAISSRSCTSDGTVTINGFDTRQVSNCVTGPADPYPAVCVILGPILPICFNHTEVPGLYGWFKKGASDAAFIKFKEDDGCSGVITNITEVTEFYRETYKWLCALGGYYLKDSPVHTSNIITVYPSNYSPTIPTNLTYQIDRNGKGKYVSVSDVSECGKNYIISVSPIYGTNDFLAANEKNNYYKWTIPAGWIAGGPLEGYGADYSTSGTKSTGRNYIIANPSNLYSKNSGIFHLDITVPGICGVNVYSKDYVVNYNFPGSNEKPKVPVPSSFLTNQNVIFRSPNTNSKGIKTWSFHYAQNGLAVPSSSYTLTPISTPDNNAVFVNFSESLFTNNNTQLSLYARYDADFNGCFSITSKISDNFTLLSSNFTPPAPTNAGTYTGACVGVPETFNTNYTNNKAPVTWKFYLDGSTVPLSITAGDYTITQTGTNMAKVTFNDQVLYESARGDVAKITAVYDVNLALGNKRTSAPSHDIDVFSKNVPLAQKTVEFLHLCTGNAKFRLLGDTKYKKVTFNFRYPYGTNKYGNVLSPNQTANFPARQLLDGSWICEAPMDAYYAGINLQYRVKVETGCSAFYMYDWPTTPAQVNTQSFVLSNGSLPAYTITMRNGREQISSITGQYLELGKCINDVVTITADFPGSNPGDISSVDWAFDYRDNKGPVYSTSTNGNQLILNISDIPASTNNYLEVTAHIFTSDNAPCLSGGSAVQIFGINNSPDTIQVPVITSLPQKDKGKDSYCVGNNLYLYSTTIPGAIGYEWLTPDQKVYRTQNLKIPLTDHLAQSGDYKVRAFNESCAGNYATLNSTIQQLIAPSNPYYAGYQDVTGRLGTKVREISVASADASLTDYHWYYGHISITNSIGETIACARPEDIDQLVLQFDGSSSINAIFSTYVQYGQTYYYMDRCDYTVILKDHNTGCFSDPLLVYTDGVQSPQLRRGLTDSTASNPTLIKLYPNPASDKLTIETGFESYKIQLINLYGSVVLFKEVAQSTSDLDLSSVANGMYLVNIINGGNTTRRKIEVIR